MQAPVEAEASAVPIAPPRRGITGHEWEPPGVSGGLGRLRIANGTSKDGVAVAYEQLPDGIGKPKRAIYIRAGEAATLSDIGVGHYVLRFMLGVDWDEEERVFQRDLECHAFVDALNFTETEMADSIRYEEHSVTLHNVLNGNAHSAR